MRSAFVNTLAPDWEIVSPSLRKARNVMAAWIAGGIATVGWSVKMATNAASQAAFDRDISRCSTFVPRSVRTMPQAVEWKR